MTTRILATLMLLLALLGGWASGAESSPSKVCLSFWQTLGRASSLKELFPYWPTAKQNQLKGQSGQEEQMVLQLMQGLAPQEVKVVSEKLQGDRATVVVTGKVNGKLCDGKASLSKEQGTWRVLSESWTARK